jgi:Phage tail tube protein
MATIPVGAGLGAQLVVKDESTWGVAPSLASGLDAYEFNSETMELKKTSVDGQGLAAGHVYKRAKRRVLTNYDCNGDVAMDLPTRNLGWWLRYMVGDFTETPTQIASSGIYKTIFQPKSSLTGHSFTMQKGVPAIDATVEPFTYVGCKVAGFDLSVATGAIASFVLHIDARNELAGAGNGDPLNGSVPTLATWVPVTTGLGMSVWHFRQATLFTGGTPTLGAGVVSLVGETALGNVKTVSLSHSTSFDTNRIFVGGNGFKSEQLENGYRSLTGSFDVEWLSTEAMYNAYAADTTTSLQLTFTGPVVSTSNYLLDIIVPNIKLNGESPKVPGPPVIQQSVSFEGYDDETTVPLQIQYQSEDSSF